MAGNFLWTWQRAVQGKQLRAQTSTLRPEFITKKTFGKMGSQHKVLLELQNPMLMDLEVITFIDIRVHCVDLLVQEAQSQFSCGVNLPPCSSRQFSALRMLNEE